MLMLLQWKPRKKISLCCKNSINMISANVRTIQLQRLQTFTITKHILVHIECLYLNVTCSELQSNLVNSNVNCSNSSLARSEKCIFKVKNNHNYNCSVQLTNVMKQDHGSGIQVITKLLVFVLTSLNYFGVTFAIICLLFHHAIVRNNEYKWPCAQQ